MKRRFARSCFDAWSEGGAGGARRRTLVTALYERIGLHYSELRRPDPRIARAIVDALGGAKTVLNVGAGSGAHEPAGRDVTAVEPSGERIRKRAADAAPVDSSGALH